MQLFAMKNLSASEVEGIDLNQLIASPVRPTRYSGDKKAYSQWTTAPTTEHLFFNAVEATFPTERVSKSNDPALVHGLIADWDSEFELDSAISHIRTKMPHHLQPVMVSSTFSGGVRAIWQFETPVNVFNKHLLKEFYAEMKRTLKVGRVLPGLDKVWDSPFHYFERGTNWQVINTEPIPETLTGRAMMVAAGKTKKGWKKDLTVPIEDVEKAVNEFFPGKWEGDFAIGARGPRFWDASATNANTSIVRPEGMTYFSDGCGFASWGDIFGMDWVRKYEGERTVGISENYYYDGKEYYAPGPDPDGALWLAYNGITFPRHLKCAHGLSSSPAAAGEASEVEVLLNFVETQKRVKGRVPFVFNPNRVVKRDGKVYLNDCNTRPRLPDTEASSDWATDFPFIADFLDNLFWDEYQLKIFLSWLSFQYKHAVEGDPHNGQNLFIVGPAGRGKTLLTNRLIGDLMGGSADAGAFLMGRETFSGNLFDRGIWTVDDESGSISKQTRDHFSAVLKKTAANEQFAVRAMYKEQVETEWFGRIIVTANDDPESLRLLPTTDISNSDKLIMLRVSHKPFEFPDRADRNVHAELAAFGQFLMGYEIPEECRGQSRYGIKAYCDEIIHSEIQNMSTNTHFLEVIETWRYSYAEHNTKEAEWFGNATSLLEQLSNTFADNTKVLEGINRQTLGTALAHFLSQELPWIKKTAERHHGKVVHGYRVTLRDPQEK